MQISQSDVQMTSTLGHSFFSQTRRRAAYLCIKREETVPYKNHSISSMRMERLFFLIRQKKMFLLLIEMISAGTYLKLFKWIEDGH